MAGRWSTENPLKSVLPRNASALALDCTGKLALLAGHQSFDIVKLDNLPIVKPICVSRKGKMKTDVTAAEWNPHDAEKLQFATISNQVAEIYNSNQGDDWILEHTLKAHTRNVSDLNWSVFDPCLLATCSADTYTYLWDTRTPKKPCMEFSAIAGAGQVKWNKKNPDTLATVHEGGIRLWDKKKGNQTVHCISAHPSTIYGLDWSPVEENYLATAAQDGTAKIWDITDSAKCKDELRTDSALWRIRYAPFGDGIITLMLPQIRQVDKMLFLWSQSDLSLPVFSFTGHEDNILDFHWRKMREDSTDYQLVTWSRDRKLLVWRVEPHIQRLCGVDTPDVMEMHSSGDLDALSAPPSLSHSSGTATPTQGSIQNGHGFIGESPHLLDGGVSTSPEENKMGITLDQELSRLQVPVRDVMVDKIDRVNRTCVLVCTVGKNLTELGLIFPEMYPVQAIPHFKVVSSNCIRDLITQENLIKSLQETCYHQLEIGKPCIEACTKQLSALMDAIILSGQSNLSVTTNRPVPPSLRHNYGGMMDGNVPFPKTCGARFCGVDKLIVFSRPSISKKGGVGFLGTPKALSALSVSTISSEVRSLGTYYKDRERKQKRTGRHRRKSGGQETGQTSNFSRSFLALCDVSLLLPIHHNLAESYKIIPDDIPLMCSLNTKAAAAIGRSDLVQTWSMVAHACVSNLSPSSDPDQTPWAYHPFGRNLIMSLFEHYCNIHDVQMLAMLCCIFKPHLHHSNTVYSQMSKPFVYSNDSSDSAVFRRQWSSNSLSSLININLADADDDYKFNEQRDPQEEEMEQHHNCKQLLDPSKARQYDQFLLSYAEILFRWKLLDQRAQVLQRLTNPNHPVRNLLNFSDLVVSCYNCRKSSPSIRCDSCRRYKFQCSICHLMVKGCSFFCLVCGHGGHVTHMMNWFQLESLCPTGCGCECELKTKKELEKSIALTPQGLG